MNGISASEQAQPTLEGNRCANNVQAGIAFFDKSGGSVQGNVLTGNKWGLFVMRRRIRRSGQRHQGTTSRTWTIEGNRSRV
jgi:parallel beta-helix repeat protein